MPTTRSERAQESIPEHQRYVVLVYMHDHWGVTYTTADKVDAERVRRSAALKVPKVVVVDTEPERAST